MSDDVYRAAFTAAAEAMIVLRPHVTTSELDAEIVAANPFAAALLACEPEDLAGRRLGACWPAPSSRSLRRCVGEAHASRASASCAFPWRSGGVVSHLTATIRPEGEHLVMSIADTSELHRARQEIDRQRREFAAVGKVMATRAAHLADAAAAAETARAALLEEIARREELERELQRMAHTDALTGVLNRHGFAAEADRLVGTAQRTRTPLAVVLVDADHFKAVNDTHGHAAGDAALAHLALLLLEETRRGTDVVGRMGGEEFVLLMPRTDLPGAVAIAERLCAGIAQASIAELRGARLTASFGVAVLSEAHAGFADVLREADEALYRAKRAGRNRVEHTGQGDDAAAA